jgi:hypothetical protein
VVLKAQTRAVEYNIRIQGASKINKINKDESRFIL